MLKGCQETLCCLQLGVLPPSPTPLQQRPGPCRVWLLLSRGQTHRWPGEVDKLSFVEAPVRWHQEAREEGAPRLGCSIPHPPHTPACESEKHDAPTSLPSATGAGCVAWALSLVPSGPQPGMVGGQRR